MKTVFARTMPLAPPFTFSHGTLALDEGFLPSDHAGRRWNTVDSHFED